jgi:hypothetical protein
LFGDGERVGRVRPAERHTHDRSDEYRRVVDLLKGRGMDYRVAVELADPASRCTEALRRHYTDVTAPACHSDEVLQKESRYEACTLMNAIA